MLLARTHQLVSSAKVDPSIAVLDIEAIKTPAPAGWPIKTRFQPVMVGIGQWPASGSFKATIVASDDEADLIDAAARMLAGVNLVLFSATRDFDMMVLTGRWVSARRQHASEPGPWPSLRLSQSWTNLKKIPAVADRSGDRPSVEVLRSWPAGDREWIWRHNLLDLLDLKAAVEGRKISLSFS